MLIRQPLKQVDAHELLIHRMLSVADQTLFLKNFYRNGKPAIEALKKFRTAERLKTRCVHFNSQATEN